jgi:hypothetical protein
MSKKKMILIFFLISLSVVIIIIYSKINNVKETHQIKNDIQKIEDEIFNSNIIENVNYYAKDVKGNEYTINASKGEIDIDNSNIIFLTDVEAYIKLTNSENIKITSNFGKYNIVNYDTIFSRNVVMRYLDNKIDGEYLDFSILRNSMIVTRNVIYTNKSNILKSDVMEMDLTTKNIKIFMQTEDKKVNVKSYN